MNIKYVNVRYIQQTLKKYTDYQHKFKICISGKSAGFKIIRIVNILFSILIPVFFLLAVTKAIKGIPVSIEIIIFAIYLAEQIIPTLVNHNLFGPHTELNPVEYGKIRCSGIINKKFLSFSRNNIVSVCHTDLDAACLFLKNMEKSLRLQKIVAFELSNIDTAPSLCIYYCKSGRIESIYMGQSSVIMTENGQCSPWSIEFWDENYIGIDFSTGKIYCKKEWIKDGSDNNTRICSIDLDAAKKNFVDFRNELLKKEVKEHQKNRYRAISPFCLQFE